MTRRRPTRALALAGALALIACSEQTPEDAATANLGASSDRAADAPPPGELPPALSSPGAAGAAPAGDGGISAPPPAIDGRPPDADRAPPEIVPDAALDPPPRPG